MMDEKKESQKTPEPQQIAATPAARYEDVLMREAYQHIEKGEYEKASTILGDVLHRFGVTLAIDQKSVINSELANIHFWLGDYASAQHYCQEALIYGSNNDQAYEILGKIAVMRFQFPVARAYFSRITYENPSRPLGLCLVSIKLRDILGAESFLGEAARNLPPTNIELGVYRAYIILLKGDAKLAVQLSRELLKKCSSGPGHNPFLLLLLAEIFMTSGNYGEAVALANQAGSHCPQNDHVFAIRAHAAYAEEDYNAARDYAEKSVEFNELNAYAKTVLMKLACRDGHYDLAESIGIRIISDSPEYSLGHANLGDVYFSQERYALAQIEYEQTQQLINSDTKGARLRQARLRFIAGDYNAAVTILEQLIEHQHTYYDDAMCDLALCYDKLGDEENRKRVLDKMAFRKSFYHRTESILKSFQE